MKYFLSYVFILFTTACYSQQNFIPNSGFEKIIGYPEQWFYTGNDFNLVFEDWKSPTQASPDVYSSDYHVPNHWVEKGFYRIKPHQGKTMVGITLYGCNQGKLHCREYITAPLLDSLVIGQQYYLSMWVAPMNIGLQMDKIQIAFDKKPVSAIDDRLLELKPFYDLPVKFQSDWQKIELRFYAETEADHITIGNFRNDEATKVVKINIPNSQPYGYYYIDEINLYKIPPVLPREIIGSYDTTEMIHNEIELKNIYFDFDEIQLLPASYLELNKLLKLLVDHPAMKINITGHTDRIGNALYNKTLSLRRANAVATFLIRHYIDPIRLKVKGLGYDQPIASNDDEEGRRKNRRVVFEIRK